MTNKGFISNAHKQFTVELNNSTSKKQMILFENEQKDLNEASLVAQW